MFCQLRPYSHPLSLIAAVGHADLPLDKKRALMKQRMAAGNRKGLARCRMLREQLILFKGKDAAVFRQDDLPVPDDIIDAFLINLALGQIFSPDDFSRFKQKRRLCTALAIAYHQYAFLVYRIGIPQRSTDCPNLH